MKSGVSPSGSPAWKIRPYLGFGSTLPETTPVLEASALQDDLRRAQIEPFAWVINGSLAAAHPTDPILRARAEAELAQIAKVKGQLARRVALIPFQSEEPAGIERLTALATHTFS